MALWTSLGFLPALTSSCRYFFMSWLPGVFLQVQIASASLHPQTHLIRSASSRAWGLSATSSKVAVTILPPAELVGAGPTFAGLRVSVVAPAAGVPGSGGAGVGGVGVDAGRWASSTGAGGPDGGVVAAVLSR